MWLRVFNWIALVNPWVYMTAGVVAAGVTVMLGVFL